MCAMQTHPETNFRRCCNVSEVCQSCEKKDTGPRYSYLPLFSNEENNTFRSYSAQIKIFFLSPRERMHVASA